jgi:hypothetical protein
MLAFLAMITKQQYVEYRVSTPIHYTWSNLAEHLARVSHDAVTDYLARERHTARHLWDLAQHVIDDSPAAFLLIDHSGHHKRYARKIELVKPQYSGNQHGLGAGNGVVNLVHSSGATGDFAPIDYRIYAPDADGKTKHDHVGDMLVAAMADKQLQARTMLVDSWYASADNLTLVHRAGRIFYTTLKANRLVSLDTAQGYMHLSDSDWTPERLPQGVNVRLQNVPCNVRVFTLLATHGDIDWVITNAPDSTRTSQAGCPLGEDANDVRWQVEALHRGLKQLTGTQRCQCRNARSQRKHLAGCYHAWRSLKNAR